jgi:hypothetical protein
VGLFDIFSTEPAEDAAEAKKRGLNAAYDQASREIIAGRNTANDYYGKALGPFQQLYDTGYAGVSALADAQGLNGPEGNARARQRFQSGPGYDFAVDQGLAAIDRGAAARGTLSSGGTRAAEQAYGTNLANQEWGNYHPRFSPLTSLAGSAASGMSGVNTHAGDLNYSAGKDLADYGWKQQTGIGDAQAAADLAGYAAAANSWGAIFKGLELGSKLLGFNSGAGGRAGGGFGNFFSGLGGGNNADTNAVTGLGEYQ